MSRHIRLKHKTDASPPATINFDEPEGETSKLREPPEAQATTPNPETGLETEGNDLRHGNNA
jgi:hypothetical protein